MSKSLAQWQSYIGTSLKKTAEATLETAKRIAKYKESSKPDDFTKNMKKWFNFSPSHLSYWDKIDEHYDRFNNALEYIPASSRALYELAGIKDDLWSELMETKAISPSITVEGAKALKARGNIVKQISEKYSEADNYLEIMQAASNIKNNTTSLKDFNKHFKIWISENPPQYEPVIESKEAIKPDKVIETTHDIVPSIRPQERIDALKVFGIFTDKPITDRDVLTFLDKMAGNDETKINLVALLESK